MAVKTNFTTRISSARGSILEKLRAFWRRPGAAVLLRCCLFGRGMVAFRLSWRIPGLEMFHFIELQWGKESLMIYPPVHVSLGAFVMPGTGNKFCRVGRLGVGCQGEELCSPIASGRRGRSPYWDHDAVTRALLLAV